MDKTTIENLIQNCNADNLAGLFRQKTRNFSVKRESLPDYNDEHFTDCTLVGDFRTYDDQLDMLVFMARVGNELSERSGKKLQYELGKKILKNTMRYAGGFFVFYDDRGSFRFSLIYDIPLPSGKRQFSNFRRYTYFVSREQTNKTFIQQISEADFSSLPKIIEAFSVDKVRKQFYTEIATWYFWSLDKIKFPDDYKYASDPAKDAEIRNSTNLIRLITRIIFIWFLKEKKLIPGELFDAEALKNIVKDFYKGPQASNYYNAILQNLFFGTLNQQMDAREFANDGSFLENRKEYEVKTLYRYADKFNISKDEAKALFKDIPFLNGGLFDCLDKEGIYIDGFSRNPKKQAIVYDYLFFQPHEEKVNLAQYQMGTGRTVRGLFEILKSYNFTIDESTPIDQEVALDPELLGKVFEELLASYNPETASTARKATGSYYTPREVVDFMVQQSLKQYLMSHSQLPEDTLERLLAFSDDTPDLSEEQKKQIVELIDHIKILDPACGSGAFPMGILHQLVFVLQKLDPDNKLWYELQYNKALKATEEAFKHTDKDERETLLKEINESFDENINYPDYARKLYLIENCIYGVDIQPIAIQISKLRFFISLVLDQKIDASKNNYGIRPLPNLETKFVAANTLLALEKPKQLKIRNLQIGGKEDELKALRHKYFTANTRNQKLALQQKDNELRKEIAELLKSDGWPSKVAEQISFFNPYDPNQSADWFDPEWMFGVTDGFDIVIGNPPYIQLQKDGGRLAKLFETQNFTTFARTGDIYCLFYEKGIQLLKSDGLLCYITSNKWMRAGYGEKLRSFFTQYTPLILIDLGPGVFENATVDTNILLIQKRKHTPLSMQRKAAGNEAPYALHALTLQKDDRDSMAKALKEKAITLTKLTKDAWFIGSNAVQQLKEKIERIGKPLKDWDVNIYRGILTGLNEAFIITTEKRNEILSHCKDDAERQRTEAIIKPILRGRDIKRYYYEWAGLWVIVIPAGWTNEHKSSVPAETFINRMFPTLMQHLKIYEEKAKKRDDQGDYWWELRHCAYYPEFEKEKVVYSEIVRKPQFYYDTENFYVEATSFLMTGKKVKYLCGLLNSKSAAYFFKRFYSGGGLGDEGYRYKKDFLERLPLPIYTTNNLSIVQQIETLVDKIISAKRENPQSDTQELEHEIDKLVYQLYDLTEEEIKIIEKEK
ncbi:MAG TPA: TaqI-like C-terminal specificity domain-containing protein [Bacteroidales bacterium]|nr:TaqI-like C-terminal specificity domain-containing protein [Bacteroidales bacterium]